jgi:hypothetical protein
MKEYKIIKKGFWKKDEFLEDLLNQYGRDGWAVITAIGDHGDIQKIILERDKSRTY